MKITEPKSSVIFIYISVIAATCVKLTPRYALRKETL